MGQLRDRSRYFTSQGVDLIRAAMQQKGWIEEDLANEIDARKKNRKDDSSIYESLCKYLSFQRPPQKKNILLIANLLGLNPNDLVEEPLSENSNTSAREVSANEIDLRNVSKNLLEDLKKLTTEALTAGDGIRFDFDDVFVPLGVVERQERTKRNKDDGAPDRGSELYEDKVTPITHKDFFEDVLLWGNTKISKGKRIAVIGEAGAGKTTQLQKIGSWLLEKSDDIPVWISLTDLGAKSLREYLFENWVREATGEIESAPQAWKDSLGDAIKSGKVWLLLDGVDEMTVSNPLSYLSTQLNESWLKNVRVVLTCRVNVWDGGKNALTGFDVYRNLDFDYPDDVYKFIGKWFVRSPDLAESLTQALEQSGKERIRDMVKNPLRLTLLCFSWQKLQGGLPETKAGLYEWFVNTFYDWKREEVEKVTGVEINSRKIKEINKALGELAKAAIDSESSRFRLTETFIRNNMNPDLFDLADKLNWLNKVGDAAENSLESVYAFYHPSFQEYFAALAINDWKFLIDHNPDYPEKGIYRIFNNQWREVILLWIGRLNVPDSQKDAFLETLINFDNKFGNVYSLQAYLLAGFCINEWEKCTFAEKIFSQIIDWSISGNFCMYARNALLKMNDRLVIKGLTKLINLKVNTDILTNRLSSAMLLLDRDINNETAIQVLIRLTESNNSNLPTITSQRLSNLFSRYNSHANAPIRLNQWIKIHQWLYSRKKNRHINNFFKLTAASCLIGFRSYHKKALALIKKYGDDDYKLSVAESLANKNCFYDSIEDITTEVLQNSSSKYTKLRASEILLNIGRKIMIATYQIVSTIEDEFETDVDQDTFWEVPKLLLKASEYPEAKIVIISRLKFFIASNVKNSLEVIIAIQSLILIQGNDHPESLILIQRLFDIILTDIVKDFRIDAAQALIDIGGKDIHASVIQELIYLLPPTLDCEEKKFKDESLNGKHEEFFQQDIFGCITQIFEQKLLTAEEYIKSLQSIFTLYNLGIINIDKNLCFSLLWHSSETISYPDFYRLFYSQFNSIYHQNKDNEHIVCKLESEFLECDAIQKELDRNTDYPEIRCLVIDIRHLDQESDPNIIAKKLTNKIFNSIGRRIPVVQDVSCLERELLNLQLEPDFEKLAIALYGKSANEAIAQLCQNLTDSIHICPFTGEKSTQQLTKEVKDWLRRINLEYN